MLQLMLSAAALKAFTRDCPPRKSDVTFFSSSFLFAALLFTKSEVSLLMLNMMSLSQQSFFMMSATNFALSVPAAPQMKEPPQLNDCGPVTTAQSP